MTELRFACFQFFAFICFVYCMFMAAFVWNGNDVFFMFSLYCVLGCLSIMLAFFRGPELVKWLGNKISRKLLA